MHITMHDNIYTLFDDGYTNVRRVIKTIYWEYIYDR